MTGRIGVDFDKGRKVFISGHEIYHPVLPGFRHPGKKCHSGGYEGNPYREFPNDPGTAFDAALDKNTGKLTGDEIPDCPVREHAGKCQGNISESRKKY